jgi:AraC-like DNA-binding protein
MPETSVGWLAGLRDPHVSRALKCIHGQPDHHWTLPELSRAAGLSRSIFADRFAARVGIAPMQYLKKWRIQLASGLLKQTRRPLSSIAEEVGYHSEAAFIRAFKSSAGMPPGAWRRQQS